MSLWAKHTSAKFLLFEKVVGMVPVRLQTHVKVSTTKAARQSLEKPRQIQQLYMSSMCISLKSWCLMRS